MRLWVICFLPVLSAIISYEPPISFMDGVGKENVCRTRLERQVSGLSGMIFSHTFFGVTPYNASKNCFMMISAPIGYRIRLRVVEFDVLGHGSTCEKDTLHVFDHESAIEPAAMQWSGDDSASPGAILGQFCGRLNASQQLAVSSQNALTLWWHSDGATPKTAHAKGFQLIWNAFRKIKSVPCSTTREFMCGTDECIPAELACNRHADCRDRSDLLPYKQASAGCENVDLDPLSSISGLSVLLLSAFVVLCIGCFCFCLCACCRCIRRPDQFKAKETPAETQVLRMRSGSAPFPPAFQPPSPPKLPLPPTGMYSPRHHNNTYVTEGLGRVHMSEDYGIPVDGRSSMGEYTYVPHTRNLV